MWSFDMKLFFIKQRIKPGFVKGIYQQMIDAGFAFKSGYSIEGGWTKHERTFEEVCDYNQARFEERLIADFPNEDEDESEVCDHEIGYRRIYFEREGFSKIHAFWLDYNKHPILIITIPEEDVQFSKPTHEHAFTTFYIQEKIEPLKNLALKIWENQLVDVIQTAYELDDPDYYISDIAHSRNIHYKPFALLFKRFYENFPEGYFERDFAKAQITEISHNGIYVEQTHRIVPEKDSKRFNWNNYGEVRLYHVKLERSDAFEELIEHVAEEQRQMSGCLDLKYQKQRVHQVRLGKVFSVKGEMEPRHEGSIMYHSYWEFDNYKHFSLALKWFNATYKEQIEGLLIEPPDINTGYFLN